jgi:hypothetical protein
MLWVLHHVHVWHRRCCRLDSAWLLLFAFLGKCPVSRVEALFLLQGTQQQQERGAGKGERSQSG